MKTKYIILMIASVTMFNPALGQIHPWKVIDPGGGQSASANGFKLYSVVGQFAAGTSAVPSDSFAIESGYIPGLRNFSGVATTLGISYATGWDLLSIPCAVADSHKTVLFPTAISYAFSYEGSYVRDSLLRNGFGYWLKFNGPITVPYTGTTFQQESLLVATGWNMIGTPSYPVLLSDISEIGTTVVSKYFGYSSSYRIVDTLMPGFGYWVKVNQPGKLLMNAGSLLLEPENHPLAASYASALPNHSLAGVKNQDGIGFVSFLDARGTEEVLYFSNSRTDINPELYDLPPVPPSGPDIRYATNRMFEITAKGMEREIGIMLSSAIYPVTITWNLGKPSATAAMIIDGKESNMKDGGEITLQKEGSQIALRLLSEGNPELPKTFALYQNYPNPFNPSTTIKYDLPTDARVTITIYNSIGQEMAKVKNEVETAGYKEAEWNASNAASGVYFYRIESTSVNDATKIFTQVKKMVLMK